MAYIGYMLIVVIIACVWSVPATLAMDERCARVYVINHPGNTTVDHGTSIHYHTAFNEVYQVDTDTYNNIISVFSSSAVCTYVISIESDEEEKLQKDIDTWIDHDCPVKNKCFIVSKLTQLTYSFPFSSDPFYFRAVRHTHPNHHPRTKAPTPYEKPVQCEARSEAECNDASCSYFGVVYGCRAKDYCDFRSKSACENYAHCVYRRRCIKNPYFTR